MRYEEEKPIFNLGFYNMKSEEKERKKKPEDILLWNKENLSAYIRGAFDGRGSIYLNHSGKTIIAIQHENFSQIETYQKALERLDIQSFTYFPNNNGEAAQVFIVGNSNIEKFKNKIGIGDSSETNKFFSYLKGFDWED